MSFFYFDFEPHPERIRKKKEKNNLPTSDEEKKKMIVRKEQVTCQQVEENLDRTDIVN